MKRKDLSEGMRVRVHMGGYIYDREAHVVGFGWGLYLGDRPTRGGNGVAVAHRGQHSDHWYPAVVQLRQIVGPYTQAAEGPREDRDG